MSTTPVTREELFAFMTGEEMPEEVLSRIREESALPDSDVSRALRNAREDAKNSMNVDVGAILLSLIRDEEEPRTPRRDPWFHDTRFDQE